MSKYSKANLIKDISSDIISNINNIPCIITKVELKDNSLMFYISPKYNITSKFDDKFKNNPINLHILNTLWNNSIFEGLNGYYKFGNILKDTKIVFINDDVLLLTFPFHKVIYNSYFEIIAEDLIYTLLLNINNINNISKVININNNIYYTLITNKFPWIIKYINIILDNPNFNYKLDEIYLNLIKYKPYEAVMDYIGNIKSVNSYFATLLSVMFVIKKYPVMYDKFKNILKNTDFIRLYRELERIDENKVFYNYIQTGILSSDYKFKSTDIDHKSYQENYPILLTQMIKEGIQYNTINDYYYLFVNIYLSFISETGDYGMDKVKYNNFLNTIKPTKDTINNVIIYIQNIISSTSDNMTYKNLIKLLNTYLNSL